MTIYIIGILIILISGGTLLRVLNKLAKLSTENDNLRNVVESQRKEITALTNLLNEKKEVEEGDYISILSLRDCQFGWTGKVKRVLSNPEEHRLLIELEYCITLFDDVAFNKLVQVEGNGFNRIIHFLTFPEIKRLNKLAGRDYSPANIAIKIAQKTLKEQNNEK